MTAAPARTIAQVSFSMRPPENLAAVYPDTSGLRKLRRRTMRSFKSRSGDEGIFRFCYSPDRKKGRHAPLSLQLPCIAAGPAYLLPRLVRGRGDVRARAAADPARDLSLSGRGPCPEADLAGKERRRPQPLHHHDAGRRDPDDRGVRGKIRYQGKDVARHQPEAGAAGARRV